VIGRFGGRVRVRGSRTGCRRRRTLSARCLGPRASRPPRVGCKGGVGTSGSRGRVRVRVQERERVRERLRGPRPRCGRRRRLIARWVWTAGVPPASRRVEGGRESEWFGGSSTGTSTRTRTRGASGVHRACGRPVGRKDAAPIPEVVPRRMGRVAWRSALCFEGRAAAPRLAGGASLRAVEAADAGRSVRCRWGSVRAVWPRSAGRRNAANGCLR